jgi:hypothetical protein
LVAHGDELRPPTTNRRYSSPGLFCGVGSLGGVSPPDTLWELTDRRQFVEVRNNVPPDDFWVLQRPSRRVAQMVTGCRPMCRSTAQQLRWRGPRASAFRQLIVVGVGPVRAALAIASATERVGVGQHQWRRRRCQASRGPGQGCLARLLAQPASAPQATRSHKHPFPRFVWSTVLRLMRWWPRSVGPIPSRAGGASLVHPRCDGAPARGPGA